MSQTIVEKCATLAFASAFLTFNSCFNSHQAFADDAVLDENSSVVSATDKSEEVTFIAPPAPPTDLADPGQRSAAASRGSCWEMQKGIGDRKSEEKNLTALALVTS